MIWVLKKHKQINKDYNNKGNKIKISIVIKNNKIYIRFNMKWDFVNNKW